MKEKISITIDKNVLNGVDSIIDNINIRNKSQAIEFLLKKSLGSEKTAVILAGGSKSRLTYKGNILPLLKYNNKTVIEDILNRLKKYNFTNIYIPGEKNILSKIFNEVGDGSRFGLRINYIEEQTRKDESKLNTSRTLRSVSKFVKNSFLCLNCDILFNYDLNSIWNFHIKNNGLSTIILKTTNKPAKFGVVELEGNKIVKFIQSPKKSTSYLVYSGISIMEPEIFNLNGNSLEYDIFPKLARKGKLMGFVSHEKSEHIHDLI